MSTSTFFLDDFTDSCSWQTRRCSPWVVGMFGAMRGVLSEAGIGGLLLVAWTDLCFYTRTENIKHFQ